jgi:hypothetical protein
MYGHVSRPECWAEQHRWVINPSKGWNSSSIGEQPSQVKIPFMEKLGADGSQGMHAIIQY